MTTSDLAVFFVVDFALTNTSPPQDIQNKDEWEGGPPRLIGQ